MEQGITKQRLIAELSKSSHGKLSDYVSIGRQGVLTEGEFFQHLIAWDKIHGQVRDSKVALPVIGLAYETDAELLDNALAHLAMLGPRELLRAFHFAREIRPAGKMVKVKSLVGDYLHQKEDDRYWDNLAIQHRKTLRELYALSHTLPKSDRVHAVLFGSKGKGADKVKLPVPKGSVFEAVANLKRMSPLEAAAAITKFRIPFLIAMGALGEKMKEPDLVLALMSRMSATELQTNVKMLEKLGIKTNPALRAAFEEGLKKVATSTKTTLKTTAAIEAIEDEGLKDKLRGVQAKQIAAAGGPDGDWLVLADKSSSMSHAIETARHIAGTLTQYVKGKVWLVFFDTAPVSVDVTGLSLDQIKKATMHITASGSTSIGVGLNRLLVEKTEVDGIAIVSDGGENNPPYFNDVYKKYAAFVGKDIPVYFYQLSGDPDYLSSRMQSAGFEMQTFDQRGSKQDYYSLPNMVRTMRSNQYSLVDEILATPLKSLNDVLKTRELVGA